MTDKQAIRDKAKARIDALGPDVAADAQAALTMFYDLFADYAKGLPKSRALKVYEVHHANETLRLAGLKAIAETEGDGMAVMGAVNRALQATYDGLRDGLKRN